MQIIESEGRVIFNNLISATREFGSEEPIATTMPAEKAVASNAKGVFADRSIQEIHQSSVNAGERLVEMLAQES